MPRFSVDVYCPETRTVYEFFCGYYHVHTCQPFRDVTMLRSVTLTERYVRTIWRLEQITRAGYLVKVQ